MKIEFRMRKRKQSELKKRKIIKNKIRQANNKLKKQKKDNSSPSSNRFENYFFQVIRSRLVLNRFEMNKDLKS